MPEPLSEKAPALEAVGYDRDGAPLAVAVTDGAAVIAVEQKVRNAGGRVSFVRRLTPDRPLPPGISADDFARFNELLASAIDRRAPLLDGVRQLALGVWSGRFRESLNKVSGALERGAAPSEAFAAEGSGFPRLYSRLLQAGAAAGNLSDVLLALSRNVRSSARFRRGVFEAFVYPALLFFVICSFLAAFAGIILRQRFAPMADSLGMDIPAVTTIMTARTESGVLYLVVLALIVVLLVLTWRLLWRIPLCRGVTEAIVTTLPFFRRLYEALLWSNAADTLALLLRARVPAPLALRLTADASGSPWLSSALERLGAAAETGKPLSQAARENRAIPWPFTRGLIAGEVGGDLQGALSAVAQDYRGRYERKVQSFIRYLPTILAIILGVLVFLVALAVLSPYIAFWGAAW